MKKTLPKIISVIGPTAVGKSGLAVQIAKKFNGEIISADSRQIYRGLNIGSGKITKKEMRGVPHHLLDVANPKNRFTVIDFKEQAEKKVSDILARGKLPIICGGTGFYIDALTKNMLLPDVPPNLALRLKLSSKTADELFEILQNIDKKRSKNIDPKNSRRLIRAIEIAKALGAVPDIEIEPPHWETLTIGLKLDWPLLRKRINRRLKERLKKGMASEVKKLHAEGLPWKRMDELGLEYRFVAKFLQKEISLDEMVLKLETEIFRFAKRQIVWFKRDKKVKWFSPHDARKILKKIETFIN